MAKEVILMEDVPGLGQVGDIVRVADGHARNLLLPRGLAANVTESTRRQIEKRRVVAEAKRAAAREAASVVAQSINNADCTITVKTGAEDKMFGSVTVADIISEMKKQGLTLEKTQVELEHPIRELGEHKVTVKLHADVKATLKVKVVKNS